jgi:putative transposase
MLYVRFPLSLRNVEDLLHERGVEISHETVRFWWHRFGPMFAAEIRGSAGSRDASRWRWHLDEMFVKINGERHYLWRAVDHEGEVLESFVTKTRDKKAALKFLKKAMRSARSGRGLRHRQAPVLRCGSERARRRRPAGDGRWLNNRAENSHLPFRRRERAMLRFRRMRSLQKFASVHASVSQPFQPGTQPLQQTPLQGQPRRRSRRVARSLRGIRDSLAVLAGDWFELVCQHRVEVGSAPPRIRSVGQRTADGS